MLRYLYIILISLLVMPLTGYSQVDSAIISGTVKDDKGIVLESVTVAMKKSALGTQTDANGKYQLKVPVGKSVTLIFSYVSFNTQERSIIVKNNKGSIVDVILKSQSVDIKGVTITNNKNRIEAGATYIDPTKAVYLPSTIGGIEGMIKSLVGSNNELSSQYNVRGGSYDENLVYVNDFEIYRPYLVRSGQQEGLSFVNSEMAGSVNFSLGGFQAKYGDKMSSVLDVTYKKPTQFGGSATLSLLGGSLNLEGASRNKKFTYLFGFRQKSNQYLLQSQPTKGVYNPSFTDVQVLLNYQFNKHWEIEGIANYARNRFTFLPESQTTSFGLINQSYQLRVFYGGSEYDQFDSRFTGLSTTYRPNEKLKLKLLVSAFQTNEKETYDIGGEYLFGELETDLGKTNFGQIKTYLGTGFIQNYARNFLTVDVANIGHKGSYSIGKQFIQWGVNANMTQISDKLHEWERRDSAGFTQPYSSRSLNLTHFYNSTADFDYSIISGFIQDNILLNDSLGLRVSAGVRFSYDDLNKETILSPRVQASYKPRWRKDVVIKAATGLYAQPPFYREMRDLYGNVNKSLLAQKSYHITLGADYNFKWGRNPLKLTGELYYKNLWDLVPYTYDNIRIRYSAINNAVGYAYGGEVRLYGDLVKDAQSWVSIGVLKTMEDLKDDKIVYKSTAGIDSATIHPGYIPRPADQRFMIGMYFEDYLPSNKNFRMHLNLLYATGLPFGPPDKPRYADTLRIPDYKRVDIGFSALLMDGAKRQHHGIIKELKSIWCSFEVFNLLGIKNTLSYTWIQDQSTNKTFAVPNYLTSRLVNLKLIVRF
jgi:CarboxypepD_reg-like domain